MTETSKIMLESHISWLEARTQTAIETRNLDRITRMFCEINGAVGVMGKLLDYTGQYHQLLALEKQLLNAMTQIQRKP